MEIVSGVDLHFIKSKKFKTNQIKLRFSAPMSEKTVAGRVLSASMLETANEIYPTTQAFQERLASLYGANFSTSLFRRGEIHYVDLTISFVRDSFLSRKNTLTGAILEFLKDSLFHPLKEGQGFLPTVFEIEQKNILNDLKAEIENHFYHAHQELNQLFYAKKELQISRFATVELIEKETPESSFAIFQEMLQKDKIDFFFLGDFNEIEVQEYLKTFPLQPRKVKPTLHYQQTYTNIVREKVERKEAQQSILELAYHFPIQYGEELHLPLIVLNALLGGFAHSKLFVTLREKEGLAYTITSSIDIFSGMLRIYAGIERQHRKKALSLIYRQLAECKKGLVSDEALQQTKQMIKNTFLLSLDRQTTLIERAYLSSVLKKKFKTEEEWLQMIENIKKEEIVKAATQLQLQAIYFMEGK